MAYVAPRGIGPWPYEGNEKYQTHLRRRFMLLGQTLDGMRVYDARRAIAAVRSVDRLQETPLWLQSSRTMAGITLYASLFEPNIKRLDLHELVATHRDGPILLNVSRILELPQAVTMAAERSQVRLYTSQPGAWSYPEQTAKKLAWPEKQFQLRKPVEQAGAAEE